jgi:uncharacterized protein (DUF983 family)
MGASAVARKDKSMSAEHAAAAAPSPETSRAVTTWQAMRRGLWGRCPHCGRGRMFRAFLKVADHCPACGEALHHHRADDFPAYVVIVIVGHIMVPLVLLVETHIAPPYWVGMMLWPTLVVALALALLQPVKGAIVGLQWAMGMHGFDQAKKDRAAAPGGLAAPADAGSGS